MAEKLKFDSKKYPLQIPIIRTALGVPASADTSTAAFLERKKRQAVESAQVAEVERIAEQERLEGARARRERQDIEGQDHRGASPSAEESKIKADKIWQVDVDKLRLRPAKEGEQALTYAQAKEILDEMRKGEDQPLVVYDQQSGKHIPNWSNDFSRRNPDAAWATAKEMDKKLAEGQEPDAMELFAVYQNKVAEFKKTLGIPEAGVANQGTGELALLDKLNSLGMLNKPQDAQTIANAIKEAVKRPEESEEAKTLKKTVETLLEERRLDRENAQKEQLKNIANKFDSLKEELTGLANQNKNVTELSVVNDIGREALKGIDNRMKEGIDLVKTIITTPKSPAIAQPPGGKVEVIKKITEESARDKRLDELGDAILKGKAANQTSITQPPAQ